MRLRTDGNDHMQIPVTFKHKLTSANRPLIGMWVSSGSAMVAEICAGSGLDWVLIDMEHSHNSLESVTAALQATAAYPAASVVRVPINDWVIIKQVLDTGAQNIVVPMVSTAQDAKAAVEAMHYPPKGKRGVGAALARSSRWNRVENYLHTASEHVSLFVQIETEEALANAAEIAAVDGVDGLFVGPSDLAASMGVLGEQTHPKVMESVRAMFDVGRQAGKPVGVNAFDPETAAGYIESGAAFVVVGADVALVARGSEELAARYKP